MMEAVSELEPIVLKRRSNLSQFRLDDTIYAQNDMDYEKDGVPIEGEKFNPTMNLLGSMQNLTPHYDTDKNKWSFLGTFEDLDKIAKRLSLEDPKTKQIIKVDESSLFNRFDAFWGHPTLWRSVFIEENARYLEPTSALNELYIRILRGREDIQQPDREDQSTFDTDRSNLELISPEIDKKKKVQGAATKKKAMKLFLALTEDKDKMKMVAEILNPVDLDSNKDPDALEVLLQTEYVSNEEHVNKYGTTAVEQFIKVCELDKTELSVYHLAVSAIRLGIIHVSLSEGYSFRGERINNGTIRSDNELFKHLKDPNNSKLFLQIEGAVDTAKATRG